MASSPLMSLSNIKGPITAFKTPNSWQAGKLGFCVTSAELCFRCCPALERSVFLYFPIIKLHPAEKTAAPGLLAIILAHL